MQGHHHLLIAFVPRHALQGALSARPTPYMRGQSRHLPRRGGVAREFTNERVDASCAAVWRHPRRATDWRDSSILSQRAANPRMAVEIRNE